MGPDLRTEVETIAELKAQQYTAALGERLTADLIPAAIKAAVSAHNTDIRAHGEIQLKVDRARWALRGFVVCIAVMGGAGVERIFSLLG